MKTKILKNKTVSKPGRKKKPVAESTCQEPVCTSQELPCEQRCEQLKENLNRMIRDNVRLAMENVDIMNHSEQMEDTLRFASDEAFHTEKKLEAACNMIEIFAMTDLGIRLDHLHTQCHQDGLDSCLNIQVQQDNVCGKVVARLLTTVYMILRRSE